MTSKAMPAARSSSALRGEAEASTRMSAGTRLGEHISLYDPVTQSTLSQITNGLMAAGADAVTASERALVILRATLLRDASMVSFVMLFRLLGVMFLLLVPLVFIMRRPKGASSGVAVH